IDIGFAYSPPAADDGLHSRLVWEEPFRLAFPAERGWRDAPAADCMRRETFIALPETVSPTGRRAMIASCEAAGFRPDIRHEAA
ncbi:LysR substrate-binding domain-containing protein, partial [Acinetobacter baumannii]